MAVLFGGPTPDSLAIAVTSAPMLPQPFTAVFNGQQGYFSKPGDVVIPTAQFAWLQVRAWDARLGSTYDEVAALGQGGYGESPLFQALGGDILATGRPPQPLLGLQSFSLRPVPEPSTWALSGIGVGFLLWRWRRKA
jgi:hypothetical protein